MLKRISFTVRRRADKSVGRPRLWETVDVKLTNGETTAGAKRLAEEISYALLEHYDEADITWTVHDD